MYHETNGSELRAVVEPERPPAVCPELVPGTQSAVREEGDLRRFRTVLVP